MIDIVVMLIVIAIIALPVALILVLTMYGTFKVMDYLYKEKDNDKTL